jgi:hypothetical protein
MKFYEASDQDSEKLNETIIKIINLCQEENISYENFLSLVANMSAYNAVLCNVSLHEYLENHKVLWAYHKDGEDIRKWVESHKKTN